MRHILTFILIFSFSISICQEDNDRIEQIKSQLEILAVDNEGLNEIVSTEIDITRISLSNFLLAISELHNLNINVSPDLEQIIVTNNFSNVTVSDLLLFLSSEHNLTIDFVGNILSVKLYSPPIEIKKKFSLSFDPTSNTITIDAQQATLYNLFHNLMEQTGQNLVFTPGMENIPITIFFQSIPFDIAMDKLALGNNLLVTKTKDNFYVFQRPIQENQQTSIVKPIRQRVSNLNFKVIDSVNKILEVDFVKEPISNIINDISHALNLDVFTSAPIDKAGVATLKAKSIYFDNMLTKIFESQIVQQTQAQSSNNRTNRTPVNSSSSTLFTFKKEGNVYYFGTEDQLSLRTVEVIYLKYRSAELIANPEGSMYGSSSSQNGFNDLNAFSDNFGYQNTGFQNNTVNRNQHQNTTSLQDNGDSDKSSLLNVVPEELKAGLEIKVDYELNSFYVNGPSTKVKRLKDFIDQIDKPVPVIQIEVMIIEVNNSSLIDTGVSWGIGEEPAVTQGRIFPETNLTLGSNTVNKIIGSFNSFSGYNLGKVGPNFFASIKAMESNGTLNVRSTPRLATLNSHRATFSNGQKSFYAVTRRNIYGTNNPQTSEITNYLPIDAELGLTIKPSVSGNGQVLLDISVIQSSFGSRIAEDAPPDLNSRTFSSLIRMQDGDIAILGGLEEQMKSNKGSGVPFLARVPIIKFLFSKRIREAKKAKLTVLIRPTVIN